MSQLPLAAASPSLAAGRWTRPLFRRLAAFRIPLLQCKHRSAPPAASGVGDQALLLKLYSPVGSWHPFIT